MLALQMEPYMKEHLVIQAGLRPGELFLKKKTEDNSLMVILPPCSNVSTFGINPTPSGFALVRRNNKASGIETENIFIFQEIHEAEEALQELTHVLMLTDTPSVTPVASKTNTGKLPGIITIALLSMGLLVSAGMLISGKFNKEETATPATVVSSPTNTETASEDITPPSNYTPSMQSIGPGTDGARHQAQPSLPFSPTETAPVTPPAAPLPAPVKPATEGISSPADAFMKSAAGQ